MPAVEIDENELQRLQAAAGQGQKFQKVFEALRKNDKSRKLLHGAIKVISPNTAIPEFDQDVTVHAATKKLQEELGAATKKIDEFIDGQSKAKIEQDLTARVNEGRAFLRSRGRQKEGIEAVEKLMAEKGIPDYEAADALFDRLNPPAEMAVPGMQRSWDMFAGVTDNPDEDIKLLFKGSNSTVGDQFIKQKVPQILAEIRGQTRAA